MMKVKIVCAITMLAAVPAAAETKSPPIRQALVHEYARKQLPLARAAHAATYACHEVTSDCDFARDLRNTERCHNAERIVNHLGVERNLPRSSLLSRWMNVMRLRRNR